MFMCMHMYVYVCVQTSKYECICMWCVGMHCEICVGKWMCMNVCGMYVCMYIHMHV